MKNGIIPLFLLLILTQSCVNPYESEIIGRWQATTILEEGKPLPIDASEITFDFVKNHKYAFQGTLGYREAGNYRLDKELLFTKDSLNKDAQEIAVKISLLTLDSLYLKMNESGKERVIYLGKVEN